ncbi:MAG: hypothetical protein O7C60_00575, partial [Rickettsia endosymbiont of Ixodes persulcatus]|nr:hypothetical protein [Rickettsia endosymbiont of Ixodes persulcatus]
LSGFSNVLDTLPTGLKTDIREKGLNLSVGQKQRLALARGLFAARFSPSNTCHLFKFSIT